MGLLNSVLKVFVGDKTKKDLAGILPIVSEINKYFDSYNLLTNDELRNKTLGFKNLLNKNLIEIEDRVNELKEEINRIDDIDQKENLYQQVDDLTTKIKEITRSICSSKRNCS
jgi:preprotein translocase subunit SecA